MTGRIFVDRFIHTIDDKGRLVLPSAYREDFAGGGFLTVRNGYLALFTETGFKVMLDEVMEKIRAGGLPGGLMTRITQNTTSVRPDSQGRIPLKQELRVLVHLDGVREVEIAGCETHLGIRLPQPETESSIEMMMDQLALLDGLAL
jgi:DNA-binding transcriptional regulator/RsmH inhibitor MraZ